MKTVWFSRAAALCLTLLTACSDGESGDTASPPDLSARGPLDVAVTTTSIIDSDRARTLPVEVWYPTDASADASPVLEFAINLGQESMLLPLLDAAPASCVASTTGATRDAAPLAGEYPVVLYSHCYTCTRWSAHFVMEHLASHGFVVVAPDHVSDTLFDRLTNALPALDEALLALRVADMSSVLDRLLAGDVLPPDMTPDPERIGILGHSLGSVTSGAVAEQDSRVHAAAGLAAPMDNPLIPGVTVESIDVPLAFLVATEDNSVGLPGNLVTESNFEAANPPVYKLDIIDAGHWSVTNIAGISRAYDPGCGDGLRQASEEPFTYIGVARANELTATFVTAFFAAHLTQDQAGFDLLVPTAWPSDGLLETRE